jgi:hypothetical protein
VLRYVALATVIVLTLVVLATAWDNRKLLEVKIASTNVPMSPKPDATNGPTGFGNVPYRGDVPWVLSALPDCLRQTSLTTGPLAYVLPHVPAGATPVVPPATLTYANCTISVTGDEAYVRRGVDRFHIPAKVRFYRSPTTLAVLRMDGSGNELRVYSPTQP